MTVRRVWVAVSGTLYLLSVVSGVVLICIDTSAGPLWRLGYAAMVTVCTFALGSRFGGWMHRYAFAQEVDRLARERRLARGRAAR